MATETIKRPSKYATGQNGLGTLVKLSDSTARFDFDGGGSFPLSFVFTGEGKNIPDFFVPMFSKKMPVNGSLQVKATLTADNAGLAFIHPANKQVKAKFLFFKGGEESSPVPFTKPGTNPKGGKPFAPECSPTLEITEAPWKGCRLYFKLGYNVFGEGSNGTVALYDGTNTKFTDQNYAKMKSFINAIGVDLSSVKWSENPLPQIQQLALEANKEFDVLIQNGWANSATAPDAEWDTDQADDEIGFLSASQQLNIHPALDE